MNNKVKAVLYYLLGIFCLFGLPIIAEVFFKMPHITFSQFSVMIVAVISSDSLRNIASSWWNQKTTTWTPNSGQNLENMTAEWTKRVRNKT